MDQTLDKYVLKRIIAKYCDTFTRDPPCSYSFRCNPHGLQNYKSLWKALRQNDCSEIIKRDCLISIYFTTFFKALVYFLEENSEDQENIAEA